MAGTRTVFRGSRGRWAGATSGKAERVKVGARAVSAAITAARSSRKVNKNLKLMAGSGYTGKGLSTRIWLAKGGK